LLIAYYDEYNKSSESTDKNGVKDDPGYSFQVDFSFHVGFSLITELALAVIQGGVMYLAFQQIV